MKAFDALIFDLGGTLLYFDGKWPEVYAEANDSLVQHLRSAGLALDFDAFMLDLLSRLNNYYTQRESEFIEYTTAYILKSTLTDWGYPQAPQDLIDASLKAMYSVSQAHWKTEEDAHEMLIALQEDEYRLAILSNAANDNDVQTLVDNANLRSYFEIILSSAKVGIRKPNQRIFKLVLEKMGVSKSRVAMVGDTLGADILGAQNADIYSIWITRRANTPANRAHEGTIKADMEIAALGELPGKFMNL